MVTALHETRHAYQKANIDSPEYFVGRESKETIKQWKKDFDIYIPSKNAEEDIEYLIQSIEIDAIAFAHKYLNEYFHVKSIIPDAIKERISETMNKLFV
ncbi:MAG: hypothetical protein PHC62_06415 [Candidatus Izemoplasmatales bacterium]|jgi:hypothetical protein|nr:hypothetical protein [Candidatus Izemoplasmatales bacterium]